MRQVFKRLVSAKVRSQRGESIIEAIVSTLIAGLALLMLATVIAASTKMTVDSRTKMDEYYANSNDNAVAAAGASGTSGTVKVTLATGATVAMLPGANSSGELGVTFYTLDGSTDGSMIAYSLKKE